MRVLYFSRDYTVHDYRFLSSLANTEHTIGYLRLENRANHLEDRSLPPEIYQLHWTGGQQPARFQDSIKLLRGLKQVIREFNPDLIQAGPIQTAAFLSALSGFRPLVSTSWGYDLLIDAQRSKVWQWATKYTLTHSDVMVGDCETIRQRAIHFGMDPQQIVTFPWGVDLEYFYPARDDSLRDRFGWSAENFVVLSTRGWAPIYGIEELARAFVVAAQKHPEIRLLMLGNGPQASLVRKIFLQGGVSDLVHFPGQVKQADLPLYYHTADLYVSASHSDGSSVSLMEAMACGVPCLVSDIPGNREWVNPDKQGWLFHEGNAQDLATKISMAIQKRDDLVRMGALARSTATERANWQKNFPRLLEAYQLAIQAN